MTARALIFTALACAATAQVAIDTSEPVEPAKPRARTAAELAAQTVIIANELDTDSIALAGIYAEKRGVPLGNIITVKCTKAEQISREQYDRVIAEPVKKALVERGFWKLKKERDSGGTVEETKVRFAVVMKGVPLKILPVNNYPGDDPTRSPTEIFAHNEACLDSELAVLGVDDRKISGVLSNPYYRGDKAIGETDLYSQLLVCRLDAPTMKTVQRMIDDSLAVEKSGLRGFAYIDARGIKETALVEGDKWMREAARVLRQQGVPVIFDDGPFLYPTMYPMRNAALYFGWYSEQVLGPFTRDDFKFTQGAVAVHVHSFSASTLRDVRRGWCAPLIERGAAATLGNVYEPYLNLTPHLDVFAQRLREGFTFAEAAYASVLYLSWMTTFVGDPLYRPFAEMESKPDNEWDAYRAGVKTWVEKDRASGEAAIRETAEKMNSAIIHESFGLLEAAGGDSAAAIVAFQKARALYKLPEDRIRVAVHESSAISAAQGVDGAVSFLRKQAAAHAGNDAAELLTLLAQSLGPATAKPKEPVKPKRK